MAHTLKISNGTTTIDFLGSNYQILQEGAGWAPRVARRRRSQFAGRSPFEDVTEEMAIQVIGTSESDALSKLQDLSELLDRVMAWRDNQALPAVYLEYEPDNSGLSNSVKSVILGPAEGYDWIQMPNRFPWIYREGRYRIGHNGDPIILRFVRRGAWLGADETETSATAANPVKLTTTLFSQTAGVPWPYDIELDMTGVAQVVEAADVYLLLQNTGTKLYFAEAEDIIAVNLNFTSTAVTAASGGSLARSDDVTTVQSCTLSGAPGFASGSRSAAFFAAVRNQSTAGAGDVDWSISATVYSTGASQTGPTTIIESGDNNRQIIHLGNFYMPADISKINIAASNSTSGTANSDDLEVDYVTGIVLDESGYIINFDSQTAPATSSEFHVEHRLDSSLTPLISQSTTGKAAIVNYCGYRGDASLHATGGYVSAVIFGMSSDGSRWTIGAGTTAANVTVKAIRTEGYITPL